MYTDINSFSCTSHPDQKEKDEPDCVAFNVGRAPAASEPHSALETFIVITNNIAAELLQRTSRWAMQQCWRVVRG